MHLPSHKVYLGFELIRLIASHRKLHQPRFRLRSNRMFFKQKAFSVCAENERDPNPVHSAIDFIESHNVGDQHIYVIGIQSNGTEPMSSEHTWPRCIMVHTSLAID